MNALAACLQSSELIKKVSTLLNEIEWSFDITGKVITRIKSVVERINSLDKDEVKLRLFLRQSKRKFSEIENSGNVFMDRARTFLTVANIDDAMATSIKESMENNDMTLLESYLRKLQLHYRQCEECFKDFQSKYQEAEEFCTESLQMSSDKECEAKHRKRLAQGVGGGVAIGGLAGGVVGGGVVISIVAGLFTCGIGTAVGVITTSVIAGGAVIAGAGMAGVAGVTSHTLAKQFAKSQKTFKEIGKGLDALHEAMTDKEARLSQVNALLKPVKQDAEIFIQEVVSPQDLVRNFTNLLEKIKKTQQKITSEDQE